MRNLPRKCILPLTILCFSACKTPIKIEHLNDDCIAFDFQKWGEYATKVTLIKLIDIQENSVIWSAQPQKGKTAIISGLNLCKGLNSRKPLIYGDHELLKYFVHSGADSFTLSSGKDYQLVFLSSEHSKPGRVNFSFPENHDSDSDLSE